MRVELKTLRANPVCQEHTMAPWVVANVTLVLLELIH
jgi:uncharacterized protein (UPF0212 family)